ncbi:MAG: helix-turn-helix domain-containing protein [Candidatus Thermoplasmatota archaeon]|nr:helix-turn-helix domain-containing protein [Candidatus Thermoplasmatota archaeon]
MDAVDSLKALGLTQYEASVYEFLLGHGALEAREIARGADVPTGRIYDALHALSDMGAVEIVPGRPKRFHALPPSVALGELLSTKRMELDQQFDEMAREAARLETVLSPKAREEPRPVLNVTIGEEKGHAFLASQVARAKEEIAASLRFDVKLEPKDVEIFRSLAQAVDRGITVRAVLPEEDLARALSSPLVEEVLDILAPHLGEGLEVRLVGQGVVPFTVLDQEGVALAVKNPLDPSRYFAFLFVHDPPFARNLSQKFEELWAGAEQGVSDALEAAEAMALDFEP